MPPEQESSDWLVSVQRVIGHLRDAVPAIKVLILHLPGALPLGILAKIDWAGRRPLCGRPILGLCGKATAFPSHLCWVMKRDWAVHIAPQLDFRSRFRSRRKAVFARLPT